MALIIRGKTNCDICATPITCNDEVKEFPHFLPSSHKLLFFSNAAFHKKCFIAHKDRKEVETLYKQYYDIWDARPKNITSALEMDLWLRKAYNSIWSNTSENTK